MRETKDRHRVGKRTAWASIGWGVPVPDDAERWDVEYGDGTKAVDDTDGRRCPNAAMARGWAAKRAQQVPIEHPGARVHYLCVTVERWDADDIDDDVYGTILDAVCVTESEQYGYLDDDDTIDWAEPEPVRGW